MSGERAREALARSTSTTRWDLTWVDETGSTNADLLSAARAGAPAGSVLVADHQVAGRGRLGRSWVAPPRASLLCSVLVRPGLPLARVHLVTTALSLAAARACADLGRVDVQLKWPNDLLVGERKLAGVLAESIVEGDHLEALVVGIGINVRWPADLPRELADIATALNIEGAEVDREDLLVALLEGFSARYDALERGRSEEVLAEARAATATLGREVRADLGGSEVVGRAVDLTSDGHLVVETPDGRRREVTAGDVAHLRPR